MLKNKIINKIITNILFFLTFHFLRKIPDFVIIGQGRAGTTTIFDYIVNHPQVAPPTKKEIGWGNNKSLSWYKTHFPIKWDSRITGEATPYYYIGTEMPKKFKNLNPNIKPIVIIRDQLTRAYSHYYMNKKGGFDNLNFDDALKAEKSRMENSRQGFYQFSYMFSGQLTHLEHWQKTFPDILVLQFDDLEKNPDKIQSDICKYLNLNEYKVPLKKLSVVV